ncbi:MAG: hypothetical protein RLZZ237_3090 [Pseudomonadota bacterium]
MTGKPSRLKTIAANTFHPFNFDATTLPQWKGDLAAFSLLISAAAAPHGVGETALLKWFGASVERIALLAYAIHGILPTHVARELTIGNFRADFGWAEVDPAVDATVGLIELENCEAKTLFEKKKRKAPYLGARFLGGFGQLVDWCAFGQAQAKSDASISLVLGSQYMNASYVFALVAGHRRFSSDVLSQTRLQWWRENMQVGHGTSTVTFDQVMQLGERKLQILDSAK